MRQAITDLRAEIQALRDAGADVTGVQTAADRVAQAADRIGQATVDAKGAMDTVEAIPSEGSTEPPA
jgi:hypothetical protein